MGLASLLYPRSHFHTRSSCLLFYSEKEQAKTGSHQGLQNSSAVTVAFPKHALEDLWGRLVLSRQISSFCWVLYHACNFCDHQGVFHCRGFFFTAETSCWRFHRDKVGGFIPSLGSLMRVQMLADADADARPKLLLLLLCTYK